MKRLLALFSATVIFAVNAAPGVCAVVCQMFPCEATPTTSAQQSTDHACCQKAKSSAKNTCPKCAKQAEALKAKQNAKLAATFSWVDSAAVLPTAVVYPVPVSGHRHLDLFAGPDRAHAPPLIASCSPRAPPIG